MIKAEQILTLVKPFSEDGKILIRTKEQINENIRDFVYLTDNNQLIACAGLKDCKEDNMGEIYSLAVSKKVQKTGLSLKLLEKIMFKAKAKKFSKVFALTKHSTNWFIKHGFIQMSIIDLPQKHQVSFNQERNSSIFLKMLIKDRIRGYLPVVIDIETGGFNEKTDAMLEICTIIIGIDRMNNLYPKKPQHFHIEPFKGSILEPSAIKFNSIDVNNPFRMAVKEADAIKQIYTKIYTELKQKNCTRAILVGHNAFFDLGFLRAATNRCKLKSPFHQFSTLDTVSLSALCYGETVLAKAIRKADIEWDDTYAHSALYDTQKQLNYFVKFLIHNKIKPKYLE